MNSFFVVSSVCRHVFLGGLLAITLGSLTSVASAQGNYGMMQAAQANLDSQRAISQAQQASYHNQQVMASAREQMNSGRPFANLGLPVAALPDLGVCTPASGRKPSVQERAQYQSLLRRMRLASRYYQQD